MLVPQPVAVVIKTVIVDRIFRLYILEIFLLKLPLFDFFKKICYNIYIIKEKFFLFLYVAP